MNSSSSRRGTKASLLFSRRRRMLASLIMSSRAVSGAKRTSDDTELRVLKRKWGLIWFCSASMRACSSRRSCSSNLIWMRTLFQIFSSITMTRTEVA